MSRLKIACAALCVPLLLMSAPASAGESLCPASPAQHLRLPRTRAALEASKPVVVVALGSSSTEGWMASDAGHTYPAVLQAELSEAMPSAHVAVIDRGVGGQDAAEELARLDRDVLAIRPQLVIWQVGANGVLRHVTPERFTEVVTSGVERLTAAGVDVILMDNQRAPRILANPEHGVLEEHLAAIAAATGVNLFRRTALMDWWQHEGQPYRLFLAADGLHQNDRGYHCVAETLATGIVRAVAGRKTPRPVPIGTESASSR